MNVQEMLQKTAHKTTGLKSKLRSTTYTPPEQRPWDDDFKNDNVKNETIQEQSKPVQEIELAQTIELVQATVPVQNTEPVQQVVPAQIAEPVPQQEPARKVVRVSKGEPAQSKNESKNETGAKLGAVKKRKIDLTSIEMVKKGISEIRLKEIIKANTNGPFEKVRLGRMFLTENGIPRSAITATIKSLEARGEIKHEYEFCEEKKQNVSVFYWIK